METKPLFTILGFTIVQSTHLGKPVFQIRNKAGEVFSSNFDNIEEPLKAMVCVEEMLSDKR